jgi:hypothetical protein
MFKEKTPLEVLRGARDILARPEAWTQSAFARDCAHIAVSVRSDEASCFCLLGAMIRASGRAELELEDAEYPLEIQRAIELFRAANDVLAIAAWNDNHGRKHSHVLEAIDKAIAYGSEAS